MAKTIVLPFLGVILFIVVVGIFSQKNQKGEIQFTQNQNTKKEITVKDTNIKVEIADNQQKRRTGLSKHKSLPENEGMLFVFDKQDAMVNIWMKDMKFPIDIIWIDDGKIVQIDQNIKPPEKDTPDNQLKLYNPGKTIDYVLEVNAGFSETKGIQTGDVVKGILN